MSKYLTNIPPEKRKYIRAANPTLAYYSEYHARLMLPVVEEMLSHPTKTWTFNPADHRRTVNSMYFYLLRSIMYIVDFMDTVDGKYKKWRDSVMIRKDLENKVIIIVSKKLNPESSNEPVVTKLASSDSEEFKLSGNPAVNFDWRSALDDWIENGEAGTMFECEGLMLTNDDLDWIVSSIVGLDFIAIKELNKTNIRIARV